MKSLFEQMGGTYTEVNGYLLPDLSLPEPDPRPVGKWGWLHETYLKERRGATYITLLTSGKLDSYLADINEQAVEMLEHLVKQIAEREGITEQFKAENQLAWVQCMNGARSRAGEIVLSDLVNW